MSQSRTKRIAAPTEGRNLFPICQCQRLCLSCASACVTQCEAKHNNIRCQQDRGHDGEHNAEGLTDLGWLRVSWEVPVHA